MRSLGFQDAAHQRAWLFRTASNLAISRARRSKVWARVKDFLVTSAPADALDAVEASEVQAALMQLAEGYRAVLVLHDVAGMTHQEIAEVRGCAPGTAKSQLARARARLASLLQ